MGRKRLNHYRRSTKGQGGMDIKDKRERETELL
jgi:hypothetical protein